MLITPKLVWIFQSCDKHELFRRTIIIQQCRDNCVAFFVAMKQRKEKRMNNTFMKKKPILPLLASMAMPMVLSMLVNSLYNIVDSFFCGKDQ